MNPWAKWVLLGYIVGAWLVSAALYPMLPERVPSHWDIHGNADGFSSRTTAAVIMPTVLIGMALLFWALPWMSPQGFKLDEFKDVYGQIVVIAMSMFLYMHIVSLSAPLIQWNVGRAIVVGALLGLAAMGNLLGKVRPNFFVGIRTPWTIANERVWNDTHRLGAWLLVGSGVLGAVLTLAGVNLMVPLALILIGSLAPVVYSFVHYKRLERRGEIGPSRN